MSASIAPSQSYIYPPHTIVFRTLCTGQSVPCIELISQHNIPTNNKSLNNTPHSSKHNSLQSTLNTKLYAKLQLNIKRCKRLYNVQTIGKMSPVIDIKYNGSIQQKYRTQINKNGDNNPIYDESIVLLLNGVSLLNHDSDDNLIKLRCYNVNTIMSDTLIGDTTLNINTLNTLYGNTANSCSNNSTWFDLTRDQCTVYAGSILIDIQFATLESDSNEFNQLQQKQKTTLFNTPKHSNKSSLQLSTPLQIVLHDKTNKRNTYEHKSNEFVNEFKLPYKPSIFQRSIEYACHQSNTCVPVLVQQCCQYLNTTHALHTHGIFRVASSQNQINQFKQLIDHDITTVQYNNTDPILIGDVLKLYLRELPEPVCTYALYGRLCDTVSLQVNDSSNWPLNAYNELITVLQSMNELYYNTLYTLIQLLYNTTQHSSINQMTSKNLSVVFAPTLMRSNNVHHQTHDTMLQHITLQQSVIQLLIDGYTVIFKSAIDKQTPSNDTINTSARYSQGMNTVVPSIQQLSDSTVTSYLAPTSVSAHRRVLYHDMNSTDIFDDNDDSQSILDQLNSIE